MIFFLIKYFQYVRKFFFHFLESKVIKLLAFTQRYSVCRHIKEKSTKWSLFLIAIDH